MLKVKEEAKGEQQAPLKKTNNNQQPTTNNQQPPRVHLPRRDAGTGKEHHVVGMVDVVDKASSHLLVAFFL